MILGRRRPRSSWISRLYFDRRLTKRWPRLAKNASRCRGYAALRLRTAAAEPREALRLRRCETPVRGEQRVRFREVRPSLVIEAEREQAFADLLVDVRRPHAITSRLIQQAALDRERFSDAAKSAQRSRDRPVRNASALRVA